MLFGMTLRLLSALRILIIKLAAWDDSTSASVHGLFGAWNCKFPAPKLPIPDSAEGNAPGIASHRN